ncbi:MAG TPA: crosslink repair DNA glycosylase YcaQ family protein [Solirubrobacteraceae bacterium]|nr:crosslink repair DNA glycosylase YcaQ family protein [Solirubrobacteraceae bacterium]
MRAAVLPDPELGLSADEARRIALRAQGLLGAPDRRGGVPAMLRALGAVQLDTISVLARSHELVPYARLGPVGREAVERAYWTGDAFEYWSHAACVLPMAEWPSFAFRRRAFRERGMRWHEVPHAALDGFLDRLRAEGPLTTKELGGAKASGEWWDWSKAKVAMEWLLDIGEVVCVERRAWRRVYDLPERVVPAELLAHQPDDEECLARLVAQAGRALGVATRADLADYHRLRGEQVDAAIEATGLVPVTVAGWDAPAWADPDALDAPVRGRHRTTLLSPFDSLVWDRKRTRRVFGFDHRLEAYVPAAKREHGYFAMPLLTGGRLVGRVDPKRDGRTLLAKRVSVRPRSVEAMAAALREAAEWVGCAAVALGVVDPAEAAPALRAALDA